MAATGSGKPSRGKNQIVSRVASKRAPTQVDRRVPCDMCASYMMGTTIKGQQRNWNYGEYARVTDLYFAWQKRCDMSRHRGFDTNQLSFLRGTCPYRAWRPDILLQSMKWLYVAQTFIKRLPKQTSQDDVPFQYLLRSPSVVSLCKQTHKTSKGMKFINSNANH